MQLASKIFIILSDPLTHSRCENQAMNITPVDQHSAVNDLPLTVQTKNPSLLVISQSFFPATTPIANRGAKLLRKLAASWQIRVVTGTANGRLENSSVYVVNGWHPTIVLDWIAKLKLAKLSELFIWPDIDIFWVLPGFLKSWELIRLQRPSAIIVFMMPYSSGLIGVLLKWVTGLPLVLNLDDSLTCPDMHPTFPTRIHYWMMRWLEDFYVKQANQVIYVSQSNLEAVQLRQPASEHKKFHLIRCGADVEDFRIEQDVNEAKVDLCISDEFQIVYIGGMNGWYEYYHDPGKKNWLRALYQSWIKLGRYELVKIDYRSSSPMFIGKAVQQLLNQHAEWNNKIRINIWGNQYPQHVVQKALKNQQLDEIISVSGSIPHTEAIQIARKSDLLFLTLPDRPDGSSGGRISAKTYEYLMSDRPILAAVPKGENWNYLKDKPGVWLVNPTDINAMVEVIEHLVQLKSSGHPLTIDRSEIYDQLSYDQRTLDLSRLLEIWVD